MNSQIIHYDTLLNKPNIIISNFILADILADVLCFAHGVESRIQSTYYGHGDGLIVSPRLKIISVIGTGVVQK